MFLVWVRFYVAIPHRVRGRVLVCVFPVVQIADFRVFGRVILKGTSGKYAGDVYMGRARMLVVRS